MSYSAKVFNVMIASPSDVEEERAIVRKVIHEWNAINSEQRNIVLLPIGWDTHASSEVGSHPQEIINKQVLAKSDLLVGIFWTRLGSKTPSYDSGTVEEIERHVKNGKPAMLYFSEKPVIPNLLDTEQYRKLESFKKSYYDRSFFHTYSDTNSFKENFTSKLQLKINNDPFFFEKEDAKDTEFLSTYQAAKLSFEAKELLKEASLDESGYILVFETLDGKEITTNSRNFLVSNSPREKAKWEGAVRELVEEGYIIKPTSNSDYYEVTQSGYKLIDSY